MKEVTIKLDEYHSKILAELEALHKSVFKREISAKDLVTMAFLPHRPAPRFGDAAADCCIAQKA